MDDSDSQAALQGLSSGINCRFPRLGIKLLAYAHLSSEARRLMPLCIGSTRSRKGEWQKKQFFFEKRTKKLLLTCLTQPVRLTRTEAGKRFLVLFFKKELLPWCAKRRRKICLRSDYGLAIFLRKLDCLASSNEASLPVYAVRPEGLAAFLDEMPAQSAAFVRAAGFSAAANTVVLVPGRRGVSGAILGLGDTGGPWPFGTLAFGLPAEMTCRLAGPVDCVDDAILAFCLGAYRFDWLKSSPDRMPARLVWAPQPNGGTTPDRIVAMAETAWFVRDLINLPANRLGPAELADAACTTLRPLGAAVEVIEGAALASAYPLIDAVGAGSARPPRVVKAHWRAAGAPLDAPLVSLCGKGVCFDTGGYDLKPASGMLRMKKDMAGAAVALGLARLIILAELPVRLELSLGCVENSISGNAMRPLDILRSRRGLTVAVANTDAEGRLVLADLLAEASDAGPDMLLDFATLTGAARIALGPEVAALFCNDDALATDIETAARAAHDPVWRLPLHAGYDSLLDGHGCDLDNVSEKPYAGAVMAALFLQRFLAPGTRWAHFDIYGWNDSGRPGRAEGGEAQCLRAAFATITRRTHIE